MKGRNSPPEPWGYLLPSRRNRAAPWGLSRTFISRLGRSGVFLLPQVARVLRRLQLEAGKGDMNDLAFIAFIEKADGGTAFPQRFDHTSPSSWDRTFSEGPRNVWLTAITSRLHRMPRVKSSRCSRSHEIIRGADIMAQKDIWKYCSSGVSRVGENVVFAFPTLPRRRFEACPDHSSAPVRHRAAISPGRKRSSSNCPSGLRYLPSCARRWPFC